MSYRGHLVLELPVWLGGCCGRFPRARIRLPRELDRHSEHQGHNAAGSDVQEGQVQRQPALLLLLRPRRHYVDLPPGLQVLREALEVRQYVPDGRSSAG